MANQVEQKVPTSAARNVAISGALSGIMSGTNTIVIASECTNKFVEFQLQFKRYGIQLVHHLQSGDSLADIYKQYSGIYNVTAVFKEKTYLYRRGTNKMSRRRHLELVTHESRFAGLLKEANGSLTPYEDVCRMDGYIDKSKQQKNATDVFGWDDVFVVLPFHSTYYELSKLGIKISSRDLVVSNYIKKHIHYKSPIMLKHYQLNFARPLSFETAQVKQMLRNVLDAHPVLSSYKIDNMIQTVFNNGVVFRAPHTRRTKLFWFPLLNAGIPMTRKERDPMHELTYLTHDFGHFLIPDLIFAGCHSDPAKERLNRIIYVLYRMMSEAITIVLADMVFVDGIIKSGGTYSTVDERHIYPLFREFGLKLDCYDHLESILRASVLYTLTGDDERFQHLVDARHTEGKGGTSLHLQAFKSKYEPFFTADYTWTLHNYDSMVCDSEIFRKWWTAVSPFNAKFALKLNTIDAFRESLQQIQVSPFTAQPQQPDDKELVQKIFDKIIGMYIRPCFSAEKVKAHSDSQQLTNAFVRYMMGQMFIFHKYPHAPSVDKYRKCIADYLNHKTKFAMSDIRTVRSFYDNFVTTCTGWHVFTEDDGINFKEVFPLVEPYVVSYKKSRVTLTDLYSKLLS